jgi:PelA/Pel-15E family pectate lyase
MKLHVAVLLLVPCILSAVTVDEVKVALTQAVRHMHEKGAVHGGYVYHYSGDFRLREAEGIPGPETLWIQPPGTPAVGEAMLDAYLATGEQASLATAVDAAHALSRTQLVCGGWEYAGHFSEELRKGVLYRLDAQGKLIRSATARGAAEPGWHSWSHGGGKRKNKATLDDDVTQAATRLLLRVNHALKGADVEVKAAAELAVKTLLRIQYPCGAWSAYFSGSAAEPPSGLRYPVKTASYPVDWPRTWPKDFTGCYVMNDNLHSKAIRTLLMAAELNQDAEAKAAALRAGDFLLRAQMPEPQPAWAQQYDAEMHPVWSRAFEPSAISGAESQGAMWALIRLAASTGEKKYLEPLPRAIAYFRKSLLPHGMLARFYELKTNRPIYFERGEGGE